MLGVAAGARAELPRRRGRAGPGATWCVLSDGLWRRRFGGDPGGRRAREVRLDGRPHTVIGVMPASMDYTLFDEELWVPAAFTPERLAMHDEHFLTVLGRLEPGVTLAQARGGDARPRPVAGDDVSRRRTGTAASSCRRSWRSWSATTGPRLFVLLGAVGFVLLIACANIANLLLARGAARSREMAIRAAIGAGRGHLLRQALTESLVLAVARRRARAPGGLLGRHRCSPHSGRRTCLVWRRRGWTGRCSRSRSGSPC